MRPLFLLVLALWLSACTMTNGKPAASPLQHRQWAQELIQIRDFKGAIGEMKQAMAGNPNIDDALLYADLLESQKQYKEARRVYRKAFKYPADTAKQQTLNYRLAVLEATDFDDVNSAERLGESLPPVDSRYFDIRSLLQLKKGDYKQALIESQRALKEAQNIEQKGWAYFHMAQIYYALRRERDTFGALFKAINNGRGYALVARITDYWEAKRHEPFPKQ